MWGNTIINFNCVEMEIVYIVSGLAVGVLLGLFVQKMLLKSKAERIISDAEFKAESIKKDKIFQAKERFLKLKQEHEAKVKERERRMQSTEDRAKAKENKLEHKESTHKLENHKISNKSRKLQFSWTLDPVRA